MKKLRWDKPKKEKKWYPRNKMKKDDLYKSSKAKGQKTLKRKKWKT